MYKQRNRLVMLEIKNGILSGVEYPATSATSISLLMQASCCAFMEPKIIMSCNHPFYIGIAAFKIRLHHY